MHFFVFATVRHPFSRAISSFEYCNKRATASFASWCVDPDIGGGLCGSAGGRPDVHWAAQTSYLCTSDQRCIVDYVARVETLEADMDVVVANINANRNASFPPLPLFSSVNPQLNVNTGPTALRTGGAASPAYWSGGNEHCARSLAAWYADDFTLLGYSTESGGMA